MSEMSEVQDLIGMVIECMPYDHASDLYMEDAKTKIGTILQQIVNGQ